MVLEGWESEHRQREQQAEQGNEYTDPVADPPGDAFAVFIGCARQGRPLIRRLTRVPIVGYAVASSEAAGQNCRLRLPAVRR
jgi:hypothetical protein